MLIRLFISLYIWMSRASQLDITRLPRHHSLACIWTPPVQGFRVWDKDLGGPSQASPATGGCRQCAQACRIMGGLSFELSTV